MKPKKDVTMLQIRLTLNDMFFEAARQLDNAGYRTVERTGGVAYAWGFPTGEELDELQDRVAKRLCDTFLRNNVCMTRNTAKYVVGAFLGMEDIRSLLVDEFKLEKSDTRKNKIRVTRHFVAPWWPRVTKFIQK